jgi:polyvinyl alcohol dehydrogenase (cytochrome)
VNHLRARYIIASVAPPLLFMSASLADPPQRSGSELYDSYCAGCHEGAVPRAPHRIAFLSLGPGRVFSALNGGIMSAQGSALSMDEKKVLAEYLSQAELLPETQTPLKRCSANEFDFGKPPRLDGWGFTSANTRYIDADTANLGLADLSQLQLKWAFSFPGASQARSQPMIAGNRVFVGSEDGTVYSLSLASGCVHWVFKADAEVRNSASIDSWRSGDSTARPRLYFGDLRGNAYALDAISGRLLWKTHVDEHPYAQLTAAPRLYSGRLYVPVSSTEWAAAGNATYACCTFRGGVVALEASSGRIVWHAYSIPERPRVTGQKNALGVEKHGPAGAPVWDTPTIDARLHRLYVGTGESYTSPASPYSDAVLAFDLITGHRVWSYQSTAHDAWNLGCFAAGQTNCPSENGPDLDVSSSPILIERGGGKRLLLAGQKSGHVFALDPDTGGRLVWRERYGRGGYDGGIHWGMAASPQTLFVPMTDDSNGGKQMGPAKPGLFALEPWTGKIKWFSPAPDVCPQGKLPACDPGFSPPPTAIPGIVFQPSYDGWLRAFDERDGKQLWAVDTTRDVATVSGDTAHGGSIESIGAVVYDGQVLISSGYVFGRMPGNVLLVYSSRR